MRPTRIEYENCSRRCEARRAKIAARGSCASSHWPKGANHAACFRHRLKENCSMRHAETAGLATIRFSSSLLLEKLLRKSRAKKRITIATAEKSFARRSISSPAPLRPISHHGMGAWNGTHPTNCETQVFCEAGVSPASLHAILHFVGTP